MSVFKFAGKANRGLALAAGLMMVVVARGATVIAEKTLDGSATFAVSAETVVSNLTVTAPSTVTVANGVTLTIDKIVGSSALTKSGAGDLMLGAGCPTGNVVIAEGRLTVAAAAEAVALPSVAAAAILHLDASDRDSIVFADGLTKGMRPVATWRDTRGGSYPTASMSTFNGAQCPYLNESCFVDRAVMDFSTTAEWWGPAMQISKTLSVREVFFVVNDSTKAMPYINNDTTSDNGPWQRNEWANGNIVNGLIECDDAPVAYARRLPAGFHVVHYRLTAPLNACSIARQCNRFGGMQFGEMLLFASALTETDAAAIKTYLARKWQSPTQLKTLTVAAGAGVAVGEKRGVMFATLQTQAAFEATLGAEPAEMASATVHFDASRETSFTYAGTTTDAGQKRIAQWSDVRGSRYPSAQPVDPASDFKAAKLPFVNETLLADVGVVDFASDCSMNFSSDVSLADAFFVVEETDKRPYVNYDTWNTQWKSWDAGPWQRNQWCNGSLSGGSVVVDGVASTYATYRATNGFHVVRITPTATMTVRSILRQATSYGGARFAEMLIFGSAQTDDAANRLTAYLTAKWSRTASWGRARAAGAAVDVAAGAALKAGSLSAPHGLAKTATGDLIAVRTPLMPPPVLSVTGGALSFAGAGEAFDVPSFVTSGAVLHLDASDADSIVFADGTTASMRQVATWKDTRGGSYPTASKSTISANAQNPYLNEDCFADKPVMDFSTTAQWTGPAMQISKTLSVREAFFVVSDSTKTMPYLNDDGVDNNGSWQRNKWANGNVKNGLIECDDESIAYNSRLPTGFHVVHYRLAGNLNVGSIASQNNVYGGMQIAEMILFSSALSDENAASVKAYLAHKWQRCEALALTCAEGTTVSLADRMLVTVARVEPSTVGKVSLGADAKLVLPTAVTAEALASAGGSVSGDLALKNGFVFESARVASPLIVSGTLTLPATGLFTIAEPLALTAWRETFAIATAGSVVAPDLSGWTARAQPAKYTFRVSVKDNQVLLEATKSGFRVIVR